VGDTEDRQAEQDERDHEAEYVRRSMARTRSREPPPQARAVQSAGLLLPNYTMGRFCRLPTCLWCSSVTDDMITPLGHPGPPAECPFSG